MNVTIISIDLTAISVSVDVKDTVEDVMEKVKKEFDIDNFELQYQSEPMELKNIFLSSGISSNEEVMIVPGSTKYLKNKLLSEREKENHELAVGYAEALARHAEISDPLDDDDKELVLRSYNDYIVKLFMDHCKTTGEDSNKLEFEILTKCESITEISKNFSLSADVHKQVDVLRRMTDFCLFKLRITTTPETIAECEGYLATAKELAGNLCSTSPSVLNLILNESKFQMEVLKDSEAACSLLKTGFDNAISDLNEITESNYKEVTMAMQLMRDRLTVYLLG